MSWQAPGDAGLLLSLGDFVLNPRAEILWFAIRRRLLNDRDLHEFTPIGLIAWVFTSWHRRPSAAPSSLTPTRMLRGDRSARACHQLLRARRPNNRRRTRARTNNRHIPLCAD